MHPAPPFRILCSMCCKTVPDLLDYIIIIYRYMYININAYKKIKNFIAIISINLLYESSNYANFFRRLKGKTKKKT